MEMQWINTISFVVMIVVNALANLLPIGGKTTGQVSEAYPNLFTPAPYTFAIWGLIYLLMLVFVLYQWGIFDGGKRSAFVRESVGLGFAASCILNTTWVMLWHGQEIGLSTLCIALLLLSLILIRDRLKDAGGSDLLQRLTVNTGFSIYFGWIIAATIANISVLLTKIKWDGFGLPPDFWTAAVLLIGAGIAFCVVVFGRDRLAGFAIMWAYGGILYKHISPLYFSGTHPYVIAAGFLSEAIILTAICLPLVAPILNRAYTKAKT